MLSKDESKISVLFTNFEVSNLAMAVTQKERQNAIHMNQLPVSATKGKSY
jgi:hypothetical protein